MTHLVRSCEGPCNGLTNHRNSETDLLPGPSSYWWGADWEPASEDDDPEVIAAVEAALAAAEPQPPWLSTTCAVQYMCHRSKVVFHEVHPLHCL